MPSCCASSLSRSSTSFNLLMSTEYGKLSRFAPPCASPRKFLLSCVPALGSLHFRVEGTGSLSSHATRPQFATSACETVTQQSQSKLGSSYDLSWLLADIVLTFGHQVFAGAPIGLVFSVCDNRGPNEVSVAFQCSRRPAG